MKSESVLTGRRQSSTTSLRVLPNSIRRKSLSKRVRLPGSQHAEVCRFYAQELTSNPDERAQIGFRLAQRLGHKNVSGIDEQSDTIDYFPFDKVEAYAKAHNQRATLARMHGDVEKTIKAIEVTQKTTPIRLLFADTNEPARIRSDHEQSTMVCYLSEIRRNSLART